MIYSKANPLLTYLFILYIMYQPHIPYLVGIDSILFNYIKKLFVFLD